MTSSPNLPSSLFETIPWNPEPGAIWVASSLLLRRNLARYNFPTKLSDPEIEQVLNLLKSSLAESISNSHFFKDRELSSEDRQLIFEHFLMMHGFKNPPNGTAIVLDDACKMLATLNMGNHLELRALSPSGNFNEIWSQVAQIEDQVSKTAKGFAFNPKFGYLTSDPAECGTGLTVRAHLHTPALIHTEQIEEALKKAEDPEVDFFGLAGDIKELIGDLLVIENRYTIGMSEEAILNAIQNVVTKLLSAEKVMRDHLREEPNAGVKDQVSKAFGLIVHSHQLETKEALDLLSLMKLGLAIGLIGGVSDDKLNSLFFKCRKGHLNRLFPDIKEESEIEEKRADFLQKELEGITFND